MARNKDALSGKVHAAIILMMRWITKKNTSTRLRRKFVRHSGSGVGVAKTTKNTKSWIVGVRVMKCEVRRGRTNGFGGEAIKNVSAWWRDSTQKWGGKLAWNKRGRTMSLTVRITRSALLFCWDVYGHEKRMCVPCSVAREWSLALSNSRPLSHWMDARVS
jgi:hypothetical protein